MTVDATTLDEATGVRMLLVGSMVLLVVKMTIHWWTDKKRNLPPGPWGIPLIGAAPRIAMSKYSPQETFLQWSRIYGKIFSMKVGNRIFVVLNDYDLIQQALHHPKMQDRPTQTVEAIMKSTGAEHGVSSSNGPFWREQRKFMHNALRELGVTKKIFEEKIQTEVEEFTQKISEVRREPFDPYPLLMVAASNIICGFAWGRQYLYDDPELKKLINIVTRAASFSLSASALGTFPWLRHIPIGPHMKVINVFKDFHEVLDGIIAERQSKRDSDENNNCNGCGGEDQSYECLLDAYLQEIRNAEMGHGTLKEPLKKGSIYSNIVNLFFAGSDTVAVTLTWALLYLLRHPEVQARCHQELDRVIGQDRSPRLADRAQLPYLDATIAEVQRVCNVAPIGVPHSASEDVTFNGVLIPKKAMIIPNIHAVITDPNLWENPDEFCPERFINKDGKFEKSPQMIVFGTGPRKCLGEHVAQMELFIFLSTLLHRFEFTLPLGDPAPRRDGITGITIKPYPFRTCARWRLSND